MKMIQKQTEVFLQGISHFDLAASLSCGQSFRWELAADGFWEGTAYSHFCRIRQQNTTLIFQNASKEEIHSIWIPYFGLQEDYHNLCGSFCTDPYLKKAVAFSPGIHVLHQEPWETLCTFIISQNNHIPRIKGIVDRLCENFGSLLPSGTFDFPTAQRLSQCSLEDLAPLRSGFRAKYLLDAAKKVAEKQVDLDSLSTAPVAEARNSLMQIAGVGPKVADCVLLYGLGRAEVVPMDVWMKRVMAQLYPDGFPQLFSPYAGIAQQFLFHYARLHPAEFRG